MQLLGKILTLCILVISSPPAITEDKLDILEVFGEFLLANHAANMCAKPDAETLGKFSRNFQLVTKLATEEIQRQRQSSSYQYVIQFMKLRSSSQYQRVAEIVQSSGCNDPGILDLLKRFEIQANLKL